MRPKSKVFNCLLKECTYSASLILRGRSFHRRGTDNSETVIPVLAASSWLSQANEVVRRAECVSRSRADSKLAEVHGGLPMHGLVGEHEQFENDGLGHR